ncbi:hypothetical protein HJB78_28410 [Rhizobium lentis]|uniref:hypothetical protein n=1 Tax=Rhizobium lentis TaxID=1138194 RepID=UPI001C834AB3|nr:hypothetical protein [Rhizobium lentis]MBX5154825.1 hypothetical protein [Rhizobium lentis]
MNEPATKATSKPVDRPFNPWRFASTGASKALATEAIADVERYEESGKLRTRRRKEHDQETFVQTVEAILCDVMHHALYRRPEAIYVTRSNAVLGRRDRYRPRVYGKTFPDVLDRLAAPELGWIVQEIGDSDWRQDARRTSIRPGPQLLARMDTGGITFADLGLACVTEPIILKSEKADFWDEAHVIDYLDTEETNLFRREMREINDWLRSADIDYGTYRGDTRPVPDTGDRDLRRIFTRGRFDNGGRLFGGFWQGMSKESRFDRLVIDGEAIVELDYAQMGPRQLYGMSGAVPAASDLYAIAGFEGHRKGIKVVFSSMVFRDTPMSKMPQGTVGEFPKGTRISEIIDAIIRHHSAIAHLFFTGVGHQVQRQESDIMVAILLSLKSHGIVALPVHDAILVASSNAMVAKQVMSDVFSHHVGLPGLVDVSSTYIG